MTELTRLATVAHEAVDVAHDIVRRRLPGVITPKGDRDMVTEVDLAVEAAVREYLETHTPYVRFLGEEGGVSGVGFDFMWAFDPIDGTANFLHGIPLCGISLGLIREDRPVIGVIDLPFLNRRYSAIDKHGAYAEGERIYISKIGNLADAIISMGDYAVGEGADRENSVRLAMTSVLAKRVQRIRMLGSAAIDLAWVAEGKLSASIILSNKPWDTAGGVVLAREAGAEVIDISGELHTLTSQATISAAPAIIDELTEILAKVKH